jgi:hypothetical protein
MKHSLLFIAIALLSCTGTLTDEQKKKIKQNMQDGQIKKVSEAQITEAAFRFGRAVALAVEKSDSTLTLAAVLDSLSQAYQIEIVLLQPENKNLRSVERQLLEAYQSGNASTDNIQKMGTDSLLYTKPLMHEHIGEAEFTKALGIRMTRKQIVLSIKD